MLRARPEPERMCAAYYYYYHHYHYYHYVLHHYYHFLYYYHHYYYHDYQYHHYHYHYHYHYYVFLSEPKAESLAVPHAGRGTGGGDCANSFQTTLTSNPEKFYSYYSVTKR